MRRPTTVNRQAFFSINNITFSNFCVTALLIVLIHTLACGQTYAERNIQKEKGTVILVRCADPRINDACMRLLNPDECPAVISNTGNIKYFLLEDRLPDLYEQVRLLVHRFGVKKIILTNHTHCGFYKELSVEEAVELADLRAAKKKLLEAFPEVEIKTYLIDTETSLSAPVE